MARRATIEINADLVIKTYDDPELAKAEAEWYRRVPWATPTLLDFDGNRLMIERMIPAVELPGWRPVGEMRQLLGLLHGEGIHHRDVHLKNIVCGRDGQPLLIDWETAIERPARLSYDLWGPDESRVPIPLIHTRLIPAWWGSREKWSIKNQWEVRDDVPADLEGRELARYRCAGCRWPVRSDPA